MSRGFRIWDKANKKYIDLSSATFSPSGELLGTTTKNGHAPVLAENYIVEQDTGLKDKSGKEICDGDIVEFGLSGRAERGYVAYADEYASFEVYSKRDFIFGGLFGHAGKVIGNIHENPELLGGEE